MTPGLSSHSLRHGAAAYANTCPKLAIQWILTRGAWLLDSLTKAFAYVGMTMREDQSVGKVLAGFKDSDLPCATPSIRTLKQQLSNLEFAQLATLRSKLFVNVTGFTDSSLNVASGVLDAVLASMLIHQEEVGSAVHKQQKATGFTSHYIYRFYEAIDATNVAIGSRLTMATCVGWGERMRTTLKTENFAQVGTSCGGDSAVLTAAITQIMTSISAMKRTLDKLIAAQEEQSEEQRATDEEAVSSSSIAIRPQERAFDVVPEATTLAGCMYNWYMSELWHTATDKKQQFTRADLKACVNIMMIASGMELHVPPMPLDRGAAAFGL